MKIFLTAAFFSAFLWSPSGLPDALRAVDAPVEDLREQTRAQLLAERFSLTQPEVLELKKRMDWDDVTHLLELSRRSGRGVDEIQKMRQTEGLRWKQIAQKLNLDWKEHSQNVDAIEREIKGYLDNQESLEELRNERLESIGTVPPDSTNRGSQNP